MTEPKANGFKGLLTASLLMEELLNDKNFKMLSNKNRRSIAFCKANMPDIKRLHKIYRLSPILQNEECQKGGAA